MRYALCGILCAMLAGPVPGAPDAVGYLAGAADFSIGGVPAVNGTTVFSGDLIQAGGAGKGAVVLSRGSRVGLGRNTRGRFAKAEPGLAASFEPETGTFVFVSADNAPIEVVLGDAKFKPSGKEPAVAFVEFPDATHVTFGATKGDWVMTGGPEAKTVVLRAPTGAKVVLEAQGPQGAGAASARRRRILFVTVAIVSAAAVTAAAIAANVRETKRPAVSAVVP